MSRYIITINTEAYKPMRANEENWECGTVNDFMQALNGYKVTETSLKAVRKRVRLFAGLRYPEDDKESVEEYFNWLENPRNKARIKFYDRLCGFERIEDVSPYGAFKQGYLNVNKAMYNLKINGKVRIPFEEVFDIRQSKYKIYKGCYMQIIKK